jgi:hypothetical protein
MWFHVEQSYRVQNGSMRNNTTLMTQESRCFRFKRGACDILSQMCRLVGVNPSDNVSRETDTCKIFERYSTWNKNGALREGHGIVPCETVYCSRSVVADIFL